MHMKDETKFKIAIETLEFVVSAGTKGPLSAEAILASVREEAADTLQRIGRSDSTLRAARRRTRNANLVAARASLYRRVYEPGTEPTPLHALLVQRIA